MQRRTHHNSRPLSAVLQLGFVSIVGALSAGCSTPPVEVKDAVSINLDATTGDDATNGAQHDIIKTIPEGGICIPGSVDGCASATELKRCSDDGFAWESAQCFGTDGAVSRCKLPGVCSACTPGRNRCSATDSTMVQTCSANGQWKDSKTCATDEGKQCYAGGLCAKACEINVKANSYIGCSFWATDLDNAFVPGGKRGYYDAAGAQYAVVVSNPSDKLAANIKIETNEGEVKFDAKGDKLDLSPLKPGQLRVYNLPPRNINGTIQAKLAYKISSSVPITAYQFNPLENENVFSNDASLLLPTELLGRYYMVMSREQSFSILRGFITIVATSGNTTVNVQFSKTTGKTLASSNGKKIKVYKSGEGGEFILDQWDTLNLESDMVGSDLTGTIVTASKRVAVFAGSEAANAPNTNRCDIDLCSAKDLANNKKCGVCAYDNKTRCYKHEQCSQFITCCADHLEMQMFPIKTWGSHYVAVKLFSRGLESDYWRIMAAEDGTKVTTIPPIKNQKGKNVYVPVLNKGEWYEIETRTSFEIIAKKGDGKPAPIMVGHFMASQDAPDPNSVGPQPGDAGTGDPAFLLAIPVAQWRKEFVFLAPNKYAKNYISVAAPMDANVSFDGIALAPDVFEKVSKTYKMARIFVSEGVHRVKSDKAVAVDVYGFDQYVSYGYPAGLDLKDLKLVKEPGQ